LLVLKQLVKDVNLDAPTSVADSPKAKTVTAEPSSEGFLGIALFKPAAFLGNLASLGVPRILSGIETRWVCTSSYFTVSVAQFSCIDYRTSTKS
jgi:hypothetical protein